MTKEAGRKTEPMRRPMTYQEEKTRDQIYEQKMNELMVSYKLGSYGGMFYRHGEAEIAEIKRMDNETLLRTAIEYDIIPMTQSYSVSDLQYADMCWLEVERRNLEKTMARYGDILEEYGVVED